MKILLYGLQSSGASTLAFALAQKPESAAFVDIWNNFAAPPLETDIDIVAKVVATTVFPLREHIARFKPDVTVAVLRHPVDNYSSLLTKAYVHESGSIDEKFQEMDVALDAADGFDHVVFYEDFIFSPGTVLQFFRRLGWAVGCEALGFARTEASIKSFNETAFPWLADRLSYGLGSFREGMLRRDMVRFAPASDASSHVPKLCPHLFALYEAERARRGSLWFVPQAPLLSCDISALVRRLAGIGALAARTERDGYVIEGPSLPDTGEVGEREISLGVTDMGPATCLRLSGLPGHPFDRITARVWLKNPCGVGLQIDFATDDERGVPLGATSLALSQGAMAYIDLPYKANAGSVTLSISADRLSEPGRSTDQAICIDALHLSHGVA